MDTVCTFTDKRDYQAMENKVTIIIIAVSSILLIAYFWNFANIN